MKANGVRCAKAAAAGKQVNAMRVVPRSKSSRIEFYETRVAKWIENAEALGVSPELVAELAAKTAAARDAFKAQQRARDIARGKTAAMNNAIRTMANLGAATMQQIRTHALTAGPGVLSLALLLPPEKGSPMPPPGKPDNLKVDLMGGWLALSWTCDNPPGSVGTMYQLQRRIDGGPMSFLGISGAKSFVDQTVPAGTTRIEYQIQSVRSTLLGGRNLFNVTLSGLGKVVGLGVPGPRKRKTMLAA
jgi:hypothetical protein